MNWTDRTWIKQRCSFCGLTRDGGVSGQGTTPRVYICPDCIRTVHRMLETPPQEDDGPPDETDVSDGP